MRGQHRAQERCESGGGCPELPISNSQYGLCGRRATLNLNSFNPHRAGCQGLSVRPQYLERDGRVAGHVDSEARPGRFLPCPDCSLRSRRTLRSIPFPVVWVFNPELRVTHTKGVAAGAVVYG